MEFVTTSENTNERTYAAVARARQLSITSVVSLQLRGGQNPVAEVKERERELGVLGQRSRVVDVVAAGQNSVPPPIEHVLEGADREDGRGPRQDESLPSETLRATSAPLWRWPPGATG